MGNTILKWLIGALFAVFAVVAAMGGFGLVTSGGNPEAKNEAKSKLVNALIGIIIVLASWLLIDTVMRGLLSSGTDQITGYGPWSEVKCGSMAVSSVATEAIIVNEPAPATPPIPGDVRFLMSGGISAAQSGHRSAALNTYQNCLEGKLKATAAGDYYITSISDDKIAKGGKTFQDCAKEGCSHSANSCHYGGKKCVGQSYALDIRVSNLSSAQISAFSTAAKDCGGYYLRHSSPVDHIHTSIGQASGCDCY